ncbi:MAG: DUF488 family protein [Xenococcaceae cyanobacterium]
MNSIKQLFTIGHSNHSIDDFIALLQKHGITAVADVRSHPYSRYLPHFNKEPLKAALLNAGIRYVFLGKELGARPADLSCYVKGKALYERIAETELFNQGIQRLLKGVENYKISLMCAEKDPVDCHRTILVCQKLRQLNIDINHILSDANLESHQHLEDRLLVLHKLKQPDICESAPKQLSLFAETEFTKVLPRSREDCLQEAYQKQADKIAYVDKQQNTHEEIN